MVVAVRAAAMAVAAAAETGPTTAEVGKHGTCHVRCTRHGGGCSPSRPVSSMHTRGRGRCDARCRGRQRRCSPRPPIRSGRCRGRRNTSRGRSSRSDTPCACRCGRGTAACRSTRRPCRRRARHIRGHPNRRHTRARSRRHRPSPDRTCTWRRRSTCRGWSRFRARRAHDTPPIPLAGARAAVQLEFASSVARASSAHRRREQVGPVKPGRQ